MLLGSGIYFTVKLKFIQFNFKQMIFSLLPKKEETGITPLQTLNIALAARIGVGSLAGVSLAIYLGGIGSIFWMWISALICSVNAFCESVLGAKYQVQDKTGSYLGGPSYYIDKGLGNKFLAKTYALIIIGAYIFGFITIQANTIVKSITQLFPLSPYLIAIFIILFLFLIIIKGIKGIAVATSKIVPFMCVGYILVTLYIVINNKVILIPIISNIIKTAFHFKSIAIGFIPMLIIGIQRGLFSNEAGIGSGAIAAAATKAEDTVKIGFLQMLGVYFTTLVICTLTAFVVISSNYEELTLSNINGIEITQYAFFYHLGEAGHYIIMVAIILFAFSTIITGYFYGENNLKYLRKEITKTGLFLFKLLVLVLLLIGSVISPAVIWGFVDNFVLLMALINVYALFALRKIIFKEYRYYKYKKGSVKNDW